MDMDGQQQHSNLACVHNAELRAVRLGLLTAHMLLLCVYS